MSGECGAMLLWNKSGECGAMLLWNKSGVILLCFASYSIIRGKEELRNYHLKEH